jgi:hypothetical protein
MPSSLQPANRTTPVPAFYGINRGQARSFAVVNGTSARRDVSREYATSTGETGILTQGHGGSAASTNVGGAASGTGTGSASTRPSPL